MQLTVQGKQIDLGDALRTHVTEKLEEINQKYFNHATFATVTFSKEGHTKEGRGGVIKTHIQIRVGKDIMVMADEQAGDPYASFDSAAMKVAKQLRRYKSRLRDHHERLEQTPETEIMKARSYILAAEQIEDVLASDKSAPDTDKSSEPDKDEPVVVAEMTTDIQTMSVSDAVMRLDLSNQPALLFRNAKHDELNMIYRRPDGNIGWIDPANLEKQKKTG